LPGGWEANSSASATPAVRTKAKASSTRGVLCRDGEGRSLRVVGSMGLVRLTKPRSG
jgi:hypothetical protein